MKSFLTDDNNDIYLDKTNSVGTALGSSVLKMADSTEALRQVIVNRVRLQKGEYAYDKSRGVDYMGCLLTDTPRVRLWEDDVMTVLDDIPEIKNISHWNYGLEGNVFKFELTVQSDDGIVEIKG